jgi:hypothetical protein
MLLGRKLIFFTFLMILSICLGLFARLLLVSLSRMWWSKLMLLSCLHLSHYGKVVYWGCLKIGSWAYLLRREKIWQKDEENWIWAAQPLPLKDVTASQSSRQRSEVLIAVSAKLLSLLCCYAVQSGKSLQTFQKCLLACCRMYLWNVGKFLVDCTAQWTKKTSHLSFKRCLLLTLKHK